MRTMSVAVVAVLPIPNEVCGYEGSTSKLLMRGTNAGVYDVDANTRTCGVVCVSAVKREVTVGLCDQDSKED